MIHNFAGEGIKLDVAEEASPKYNSESLVDLLPSSATVTTAADYKMPVSGDGDSSLSSPTFSPSFSSSLRIFVRTPSRTLAIQASPDETIQNLVSRISVLTSRSLNCLHLHCGRHHLPSDWTLSRCGIENDTGLQLVCCFETSRFSLALKVANDLINVIDNLSIRSNFSGINEPEIYSNIDALIKEFVFTTPIGDSNETMCHLHVFFTAGAHMALRRLYQSPLIFQQNAADFAVRTFLEYYLRNLPRIYQIHFVPIMLVFCKLFTGVTGNGDSSLYLYCRRTLSFLVDSSTWRASRKPKWINYASEFCPFVVELAEKITASLSSESMSLPLADVAQFSCFLKALRKEIKEDGWAYPIPKDMYVVEWITGLHETFIKLLKKLDESLLKIENFMIQNADMDDESQLRQWEHILIILSHCRKLGKIYEDGSELLHGVLLCRRVPLSALIRCALRNDKHHWILKHKDVTDFETRKNLVMMMFAESSNDFQEPHEIFIDRSRLLYESFTCIGLVDAYRLHSGLSVEFENEEATGYGVLREWFCLLCQQIFSPENDFFLSCPNDRRRFFPNPEYSGDFQNQVFSFAGRVIALAVMHKVQVGITLDRVFFLQLAGKAVTLEDIKDADPFLHMSCKKILEMDDETLDSDALALTFVREIEVLGCRKTIEICPGGKDIIVNSRNKKEFVSLLVQNCFVSAISEQIHHFGLGFSDMLSKAKLGSLFFQGLDLEDFDRMLGGSEDTINVEDWKAHTQYRGYKAEDPQIRWFWEVVEGMQEDQKRILLRFWTSLRYLPVEGFSGLETKLLICKASDSENCLPSSQTCFYLLLLPPYPSFSTMHYKLEVITQEHMSCTFGFC